MDDHQATAQVTTDLLFGVCRYAPTFEGAVRGVNASDGAEYRGALGVMCSYNAVNGVSAWACHAYHHRSCLPPTRSGCALPCIARPPDPTPNLGYENNTPYHADAQENNMGSQVPACASREMQTEMLRDQWGFEGYVVGDSDTVIFIETEQHFADSPAAAVTAALTAGTDLESWCAGGNPDPDYYRDIIPLMLRNGSLPERLVDTALTRLLTLRFRAGLFDPPEDTEAYFKIGPSDRGTPSFEAVALDAARQS